MTRTIHNLTRPLLSIFCVLLAAVLLMTTLSACGKSRQEKLMEQGMTADEADREVSVTDLMSERKWTREEAERYIDKGLLPGETEADRDARLEEEARQREEREKERARLAPWEFLKKVKEDFEKDVTDRVSSGSSREDAEKAIDIRNKMLEVLITLASVYNEDVAPEPSPSPSPEAEPETEPVPTEFDWLEFLDGMWQSVSFSSTTSHFYASPNCNLRDAVIGWMNDGISGGVDPGTGNLVFTFNREIEERQPDGSITSYFYKEIMIIQKLDENTVLLTGDRYDGKTEETFRRIG
jgi:hypothetical protein